MIYNEFDNEYKGEIRMGKNIKHDNTSIHSIEDEMLCSLDKISKRIDENMDIHKGVHDELKKSIDQNFSFIHETASLCKEQGEMIECLSHDLDELNNVITKIKYFQFLSFFLNIVTITLCIILFYII